MHIVDWEQAQEGDVALAACCKWLCFRKGMLPSRQDTLLKECLGAETETEQGKMFFHICNSLVLNRGLMYVNTTPKGETGGVLVFVIPVAQRCMALNGVHRDTGHQGQQRTLALTQERFWWPMMAEDCRAIVSSPLSDSSIRSVGACTSRLHQYRVHNGAEQAPHGEKCPCDD